MVLQPGAGVPSAQPRRGGFLDRNGRRIAAGLALTALLIAAARAPSLGRLLDAARGRGYVPWFDLEWKARQTASAARKPLLEHRVDPRHPQRDHLLSLLHDPALQARVERVVWLRSEAPAPPGEDPRPPAIRLWGSNREGLLCERERAHELHAADLAALIDEALAADQPQDPAR